MVWLLGAGLAGRGVWLHGAGLAVKGVWLLRAGPAGRGDLLGPADTVVWLHGAGLAGRGGWLLGAGLASRGVWLLGAGPAGRSGWLLWAGLAVSERRVSDVVNEVHANTDRKATATRAQWVGRLTKKPGAVLTGSSHWCSK